MDDQIKTEKQWCGPGGVVAQAEIMEFGPTAHQQATKKAAEQKVMEAVPVDGSLPNAYAPLAVLNDQKTKLKFYPQKNGTVLVTFWCPGCKETHSYELGTKIKKERGWSGEERWYRDNGWMFNGDLDFPSFEPSLHYPGKCHLWLRKGVIEYCWDSKHEFAGQDVRLEKF
jgi:hypothetical protein